MDVQLSFPKETLSEKFSNIYKAGKVTGSELQRLKSVVLNASLSEEEANLVDRLFHAVKRGWLEVIDASC